jgi:hypothetical protein
MPETMIMASKCSTLEKRWKQEGKPEGEGILTGFAFAGQGAIEETI